MAIKIYFDTAHHPEPPTFILANKSGNKFGQIHNVTNQTLRDFMNDCPEATFTIHKTDNGVFCHNWNLIKNFKLAWCKEWDTWFEMTVRINDSDETVKNVNLKRLGEAELSQIILYNIEINTEKDIQREDYKEPTTLYNKDNPSVSLLHRILEKAPHYSVRHVDTSIANIQRSFSFDNISIRDALTEISEELNCLVVYDSNSDEDGRPSRTISLYDLESNCLDCGHRGEFTDVCPECGSIKINDGYGEDTTICISSEDLGDDIVLETKTDSVKNCFRLVAGDDLLTATVANCNPNGTSYVWTFNQDTLEDMSPELSNKLDDYSNLLKYYKTEYQADIPSDIIQKYNSLVQKYKKYSDTLQNISVPVTGYSQLMNSLYNTIDFSGYLESGLLPDASMSDTSAKEQAALLTQANLSPVAIADASYISSATASSAVLSMAKVIIDPRYQVKVNESSLSGCLWTGNFSVNNYSDDEDSAVSQIITVEINDDYETFIKQKIEKAINKDDGSSYVSDISSLFKLPLQNFKNELTKYCLNSLKSFDDACQTCIDIMIDQGISSPDSWTDPQHNLYNTLYLDYYNKLKAIESEIKLRENEINIIIGENGLQQNIEKIRNQIQTTLNLEKYLGHELWLEFSAYRREDTYSNDNYISDGLSNAEIFNKANEFIKTAEKEIYKSANLQHQITSQLKNLLIIKEFEPLVRYFGCGNWIRIKIDDELYKLRLLEYGLDYDNPDNIPVVFSDVIKISNGISDVKNVINQASSMSTSYSSVKRQSGQGAESKKILNDMFSNGLDTTNTKIVSGADGQVQTWDSHGMLFRQYDSVSGSYSDIQSKILNSTYVITDDNWRTTKTAVGLFYYTDPVNGETKKAYGVNGEAVIGKLMLGNGLGIYNESGSLTFDKRGFAVSNGKNSVNIDPNNTASIFNIKNNDGNILSCNERGELVIVGNVTAKSLTLLDDVEIDPDRISGLSNVALSGQYSDLIGAPLLSSVATTGKYSDLTGTPVLASVAISGEYADLTGTPVLADIAVSGSYNDLTNKPVISDIVGNTVTSAITGKAVWDYALPKNFGSENSGQFLTVSASGDITPITVADLKVLLGIE